MTLKRAHSKSLRAPLLFPFYPHPSPSLSPFRGILRAKSPKFSPLYSSEKSPYRFLSKRKSGSKASTLRTFGLLAGDILLLPHIGGIAGVWLAVPVAEAIMFVVSVACLFYCRKRYSY